MEHAINFAHNQVLKKYDYSHLALSLFKIHKICRDSIDPLDLGNISKKEFDHITIKSKLLQQFAQGKNFNSSIIK